jgi:hypothetical protein
MDDIKRCLDFFGLDKNVSENELKAVRNMYLKTYHPDSGRPDSDEMAKMTNIAYEKISLYIRDRDCAVPAATRAETPGPSSRPEDACYEKKAREYLHNRSRKQGNKLNLFQPGHDEIYGDLLGQDCKKYFVDAVLNYTYNRSVIDDVSFTCGWYLNVFPLRVLAAWVYEVYPDWDTNRRAIWSRIKDEDYKKLFISAVNEYVRERQSTVKDALLALRIPSSKYYHWKRDVRDNLLKP